MSIYEKAKPEVLQVVANVMEKYHRSLDEAGVKVNVLMASPNEDKDGMPTGPAITVGGYPAAATIRVLGIKDRVSHGFDAEMVVDADVWGGNTRKQNVALIDHELTHLELSLDDKGQVKTDDANRPKLRIRKHDRQFGWFDAVANRHGEDSPEVMQCRRMVGDGDFRQLYLFDRETADAA